jgi:hypothetical protein
MSFWLPLLCVHFAIGAHIVVPISLSGDVLKLAWQGNFDLHVAL